MNMRFAELQFYIHSQQGKKDSTHVFPTAAGHWVLGSSAALEQGDGREGNRLRQSPGHAHGRRPLGVR